METNVSDIKTTNTSTNLSSIATEANSIYISDKAKAKVEQLMAEAGVGAADDYFLRVGVVGGGCSGLSYKLDFDNEVKPMDQVFEDKAPLVIPAPPTLFFSTSKIFFLKSSARIAAAYPEGPAPIMIRSNRSIDID
jgi:Fe-S cluster assembly iron-binding protein IscA